MNTDYHILCDETKFNNFKQVLDYIWLSNDIIDRISAGKGIYDRIRNIKQNTDFEGVLIDPSFRESLISDGIIFGFKDTIKKMNALLPELYDNNKVSYSKANSSKQLSQQYVNGIVDSFYKMDQYISNFKTNFVDEMLYFSRYKEIITEDRFVFSVEDRQNNVLKIYSLTPTVENDEVQFRGFVIRYKYEGVRTGSEFVSKGFINQQKNDKIAPYLEKYLMKYYPEKVL